MTKNSFSNIPRDIALRLLATLCFFILLLLQYKLISSSYHIESREIAQKEKNVIKHLYGEAIINDKLYPGGQNVFDNSLNKERLMDLEHLYKTNRLMFNDSIRLITKHILEELTAASNMDSVMSAILKSIHLDLEKYGYAITLDEISISFDGKNYIDLTIWNDVLLPICIDGNERYISPNEVVSNISVSSYMPYSYGVKFTLYGLNLSQNFAVFKKIFPLFLLTAICTFIILTTYTLTFRRWQKQKKLNEVTQDFLSSITHEFKTPISSISVSVKNLIRETKSYNNTHVTQSIAVIERQSKRIDQLVDQAIGISMFDPSNVRKEHRNLVEDIENSLHDLRLKYIHHSHVDIKFETDIKDFFISYDFFYLTTAINNLIENGIKHNNSTDKEVTIRLRETKANVLLEISDNGEGIPREEQQHVFHKFYQGRKGKEKGGLGLGLYYVDQMIKTHQWKQEIHLRDTRGTEIRIIIPKTIRKTKDER
ncbi:sensor histidine kinase [Sphingobacterium sp. SGR-19]|uniref:sensor histidine kinase n=1 Tax=Sphingobacterium sp. SGR-19 TaxID=2710886 RepID=UPI0013EC000B|nr:HAMP domain-containing sensor histidine kinase [Sphingobacterium sp. SGR-19]NGM66115.1 HAMP domain-containing histidine kinase [Sphingobacterium sp. SGR-19]